jgi:citrate lyase subunit beta/citryl-CoA lyase
MIGTETVGRVMRLRRSCLAVPGSSARMLAKAATLQADEVFLDLEDAVAQAAKTDATRELVVRALVDQTWLARTLAVRVNAVGSPYFLDDVLYIVEHAGVELDTLILPKIESAAQIHFAAQLLDHLEMRYKLGARIGLEVQIESPRGLLRLEEIATASDRIEALIFGPGDYAAAVGMPQLTVGAVEKDYPGDHWHYVLSQLLTVARAYGLQAIDGPYAAIRDASGFREVASRSALLGFDGKWAIHPDQVVLCNDMFSPTQGQIDRAEEILALYARATSIEQTGAALLGAEMVDEASRKMAEVTVLRGRAAHGTSPG